MFSELFCELKRPPANGNVALEHSAAKVRHNTVATYSCHTGYNLVGKMQITCQQGAWTGPPPSCQGKAQSLISK